MKHGQGTLTSVTDALTRVERRAASAARKVADLTPDHGYRGGRTVEQLRKLRDLLDDLVEEEIVAARAAGAPWGQLGTSKQQAQQAHARALARRPGLARSTPVDE